jgi:hypothetical protein
MRNRDKRPEEIKDFHPRLLAFLSFFQSSVLLNSQENLAIELTPEAQEGYRVEYYNIHSESDCACE